MAAASRKQVACFSVGEVDYALDIMRVREVLRPTALLRVPKAPPRGSSSPHPVGFV